jgi:hypothetical protein
MSAWWMEDPDREPPEWSPLVRCIKCGDVYPADQMYLDCTTDVWACSNWPNCLGVDSDIRLVEFESRSDDQRGGEQC